MNKCGACGSEFAPETFHACVDARIRELEKLLREGVDGFGRVLTTSDQAGMQKWRDRARELLGES